MCGMGNRWIRAGWLGAILGVLIIPAGGAGEESARPGPQAPETSQQPSSSVKANPEPTGPTLAPAQTNAARQETPPAVLKVGSEGASGAPAAAHSEIRLPDESSPSDSPSRGTASSPVAGAAASNPASGAPASNPVPGPTAKGASGGEEGATNVLQLVPEQPAPDVTRTRTPSIPEPRAEKPLRPIPEESEPGSTEIETASFNGVTPGVSTLEDVSKNWGVAKEMRKHQGTMIHRYAVDPFDHVEAVFYQDKVTSIVIRLGNAFPAEAVAKQLGLGKFRPVLVSNELGEILGQAYPERGVLFAFTPGPSPGKPTMKVAQIILEPVTAEPFVLRAETNLDSQTEASLKDLEQAIRLAPKSGRAHWLRARALVLLGDIAAAASAAEEAVRLEPNNSQYRLTQALVLSQLGQFAEAVAQAEKAIVQSAQRPHVKARALCLMGDLMCSGPKPDYKQAMQHHHEAIKTAEALLSDPHPAIRVPAKEVLVDAHLGAAHDVAWGVWNNKETAVPAWLKRASEFADDLIQNEGGSQELHFRVATRALAACVGMQGKLDPTPWVEQALRVGQELLAAAPHAFQKRQFQRELGLALYDAVQVYQMRNQRDLALRYGQQAIEFLQAAGPANDRLADAYLLGRLYFRMGAIQAAGQRNHRAAIDWFDKALPVLQQAATQVAPFERGRLGETLVSMGVSYWETGQRDKAVQMTIQGVELMEKCVQDGLMPNTALDVPYSNLSTMHRQLGQDAKARFYAEKVRARAETTRR